MLSDQFIHNEDLTPCSYKKKRRSHPLLILAWAWKLGGFGNLGIIQNPYYVVLSSYSLVARLQQCEYLATEFGKEIFFITKRSNIVTKFKFCCQKKEIILVTKKICNSKWVFGSAFVSWFLSLRLILRWDPRYSRQKINTEMIWVETQEWKNSETINWSNWSNRSTHRWSTHDSSSWNPANPSIEKIKTVKPKTYESNPYEQISNSCEKKSNPANGTDQPIHQANENQTH